MKVNCILVYLICDTIPRLDIPDFPKNQDGRWAKSSIAMNPMC